MYSVILYRFSSNQASRSRLVGLCLLITRGSSLDQDTTKMLNVWYIMHQQDRDYIIYYHTVKIRKKKGRIVGCISPIAQAFRARYMISAVIFGTVAAPK